MSNISRSLSEMMNRRTSIAAGTAAVAGLLTLRSSASSAPAPKRCGAKCFGDNECQSNTCCGGQCAPEGAVCREGDPYFPCGGRANLRFYKGAYRCCVPNTRTDRKGDFRCGLPRATATCA